ncbi:MAG TPA: MBL fold metallo-hydrolase [bacterium]
MKVTILGMWSPFAPPGGACPGYLVEADGARLLLDCGNGVIAALHRTGDTHDLAGAVISHLHPDHFSDVYALFNALRFDRYPAPAAPPLVVYAPALAPQALPAALPRPESRVEFLERFVFRAIEGGEGAIGPFALRFAPTLHPEPCHAVEIRAAGRRLVYTADTGPSEAVESLAAGADLLLSECTLLEGTEDLAVPLGHLTGRMAGALASRAGVRRLLLTHFFTPRHAVKESLAAAAKEFAQVSAVDEGSTYEA